MNRHGLSLALAVVLLPMHAALGQLRIFLSTANPGTLPAIPNPAPPDRPALAPPPEYVSQTNPTITTEGISRVYIWANQVSGGTTNEWYMLINIDADGGAVLSNLTIVNPNSFFQGPSANRWAVTFIPPVAAGGTEYNVTGGEASSTLFYGMRATPPPDGYSATGVFAPVLIGWFDVDAVGGNGSVWIEPADASVIVGFPIPSIAREFGNPDFDPVFFGFGDAPLLATYANRNTRTSIAELTIIDSTPPPGPFTLSAPANNTFFVAPQGSFAWTASATATSYTLEIDNNADFSSPTLVRAGITTTTAALMPGELPVGAYHARVRAINPNGSTTASPGSVRFAMVPACTGDGTANGSVGLDDIAQIITNWGTTCP